MSPHAGVARITVSTWRDVGRRGRELRAVFRARDRRAPVPVRRRECESVEATCVPLASAPIASGTPICLMRVPGSSMAIASTARGIRRMATGSIRPRSCSIRTHASSAASRAGIRRSSRSRLARDGDGSGRDRPTARRYAARSARASTDASFDRGRGIRPRRARRGTETVIYELHVKGITALHPRCPPTLRGTYLGLASRAGHRASRSSLGRHGRRAACRSTRTPTKRRWSGAGSRTTGATTRSTTSRRTRASRRRSRRSTRCASSRRWSGRCTPPDSK